MANAQWRRIRTNGEKSGKQRFGEGTVLQSIISKKAERDIKRNGRKHTASREFFLRAAKGITAENGKHLFHRDGINVFSTAVGGKCGWRIAYVKHWGNAVIWRCFSNHDRYAIWAKRASDKRIMNGRLVMDMNDGATNIRVALIETAKCEP